MTNGKQTTIDPSDLWNQWYDTATKIWSTALNAGREQPDGGADQRAGTNAADPFGAYRLWMKAMEDIQAGLKTLPPASTDPKQLWKQWFDATTKVWETAEESGVDVLGLSTQWMEMMEEARAKLLSGQDIPMDPLSAGVQLYNATSESWSRLVGNIIGTEEFVAAASRFVESYASFSKTLRNVSEEYFHTLQLPTRSDIARVAELVVALEEKVDRLDEMIEDSTDRVAALATDTRAGADVLDSVARRLDLIDQRIGAFAGVEEVLGQVQQRLERLAHVEQTLSQIERRLEAIERVGQRQEQLDQIARTLSQVEQNVGRLLTLPATRVASGAGEPAEAAESGHRPTTRRAPAGDKSQPSGQE